MKHMNSADQMVALQLAAQNGDMEVVRSITSTFWSQFKKAEQDKLVYEMIGISIENDNVDLLNHIIGYSSAYANERLMLIVHKHLPKMQKHAYQFFTNNPIVGTEFKLYLFDVLKEIEPNPEYFRAFYDYEENQQVISFFIRCHLTSALKNCKQNKKFSQIAKHLMDLMLSKAAIVPHFESLYDIIILNGTVSDLEYVMRNTHTMDREMVDSVLYMIIRSNRIDMLQYVLEKKQIESFENPMLGDAIQWSIMIRQNIKILRYLYDNKEFRILKNLSDQNIRVLTHFEHLKHQEKRESIWIMYRATGFYDTTDPFAALTIQEFQQNRDLFFKHVVDNSLLDRDIIQLICSQL